MKRKLENQTLALPSPRAMADDELDDDDYFSDVGDVDDLIIAQRHGGSSRCQGRLKLEKRHEKRGEGLQRGSIYSSKHIRMIEKRTGTKQRGK